AYRSAPGQSAGSPSDPAASRTRPVGAPDADGGVDGAHQPPGRLGRCSDGTRSRHRDRSCRDREVPRPRRRLTGGGRKNTKQRGRRILRDALRWSAPQDEVRSFNGLPHAEEAQRAVSKGASRGKRPFSASRYSDAISSTSSFLRLFTRSLTGVMVIPPVN